MKDFTKTPVKGWLRMLVDALEIADGALHAADIAIGMMEKGQPADPAALAEMRAAVDAQRPVVYDQLARYRAAQAQL